MTSDAEVQEMAEDGVSNEEVEDLGGLLDLGR